MSKLTTDVVTYCMRPPIKNQNMRTGKYCFTKKALPFTNVAAAAADAAAAAQGPIQKLLVGMMGSGCGAPSRVQRRGET